MYIRRRGTPESNATHGRGGGGEKEPIDAQVRGFRHHPLTLLACFVLRFWTAPISLPACTRLPPYGVTVSFTLLEAPFALAERVTIVLAVTALVVIVTAPL